MKTTTAHIRTGNRRNWIKTTTSGSAYRHKNGFHWLKKQDNRWVVLEKVFGTWQPIIVAKTMTEAIDIYAARNYSATEVK